MTGATQVVFMNQRSFNVAPVNTVAPAVTGTTTLGQTLSSTTGTWTGVPTPTFTYQWFRSPSTSISGATSSTYTLVSADVGNTIYCQVTATNVAAAVSANSNTTATITLPAVGAAFGGGYFAGQISTAGTGVADYNLVIAPVASGENSSKQWKTSNTSTAGTSSVIDGPTNSSNMNNATHPAAQFCEGLSIGGFSDWYMPAKNELEVCYYNLKPTTTSNNTSSGTNTNAVPSRGSNYTSGTPAQTSATDFKSGGTEAFAAGLYWSSTEYSATFAWGQFFDNGDQGNIAKSASGRVRAVRRVAV